MSRSTAAPPPHLLTVVHAAEHLSTTTSKLYELVAKHAIPSVRIGRAIRIPQDALDGFVSAAGQTEPEPPAKELGHLSSEASPNEPEVRTSDIARTSLLRTDALDDLAKLDRSADQRSSSPMRRRQTPDLVSMPERRRSEHEASEPRQPNSRETPSPSTDLHPCATTRRRVDMESTREARS